MGTIGVEELRHWEKAGEGGGGGKEEKIFVSVRIRPLNSKEMERSDPSDWECINNTTIIFKNSVPDRSMYPIAYTFDRVFGFESSTGQVYEEGAKQVALSVVNGINSSVFAYGQTSSGKTYTMSGITEYAVADIYDHINKHEKREFVLKFSAMEIYNEAVRDLLSMDSSPLRLLDDPERGTIVEKLTEVTLQDENHLKELLSVCEAQRQIGETSLNEMSSRSHQILRLTIESSAREYNGRGSSSNLTATVNFVDLAGSERASQALSAGTRLKEGCHINRSLLTLGTVVRKLSKGRTGHVPFRDSKLTRILQSSLGGNARTAIICTMSPARSHIEQSRNTLLFACCAKEVVTSAQVNVVMTDKAMVKYLQRELARLENELKYSSCSSHYKTILDKDAQIKKMEQDIKELMLQRDLSQSRLEDLLHGVRDNRPSNQYWDGSSQFSLSHGRNTSEDALSFSGLSGTAKQFTNIHSARSHTPDRSESCDDFHFQLSSSIEEQCRSPSRSISSSTSVGTIPQHRFINTAERIDDLEEQCKDVRCIEIHELRTSKTDELKLLSSGENDSLLPSTEEDKHGILEMPSIYNMNLSREEKQQLNSLTRINHNFVNSCTHESSSWLSEQKPISFKELALNKRRSCKASLMSSQDNWLEELEQDIAEQVKNIPTESFLKEDIMKPATLHIDAEKEILSLQVPQASEESSFNKISLAVENQGEIKEDATTIFSSSTEMNEMSQSQNQEHISDDEGTQAMEFEELGAAETVKDLGVDSVQCSEAPPSTWSVEFERKQLEIIKLWHTCNVSLFHRTCFFLLFKGDPADAFYMEVEHRRLSFLRSGSSHGHLTDMGAKDDDPVKLVSRLKQLRRERDMLYKQMLNKLSLEERLDLYTNWGIDVNSKRRRLKLARLIWTRTDMDHVKESASLVAKLVGLLDHGQALKEMFGLSFTPQQIDRRSFSWRHGISSFM